MYDTSLFDPNKIIPHFKSPIKDNIKLIKYDYDKYTEMTNIYFGLSNIKSTVSEHSYLGIGDELYTILADEYERAFDKYIAKLFIKQFETTKPDILLSNDGKYIGDLYKYYPLQKNMIISDFRSYTELVYENKTLHESMDVV